LNVVQQDETENTMTLGRMWLWEESWGQF